MTCNEENITHLVTFESRQGGVDLDDVGSAAVFGVMGIPITSEAAQMIAEPSRLPTLSSSCGLTVESHTKGVNA